MTATVTINPTMGIDFPTTSREKMIAEQGTQVMGIGRDMSLALANWTEGFDTEKQGGLR